MLAIQTRRRENNVKMYLKEIGPKHVDWIYLAHDVSKWKAMKHQVPRKQGDVLTFLATEGVCSVETARDFIRSCHCAVYIHLTYVTCSAK
jgi:hypothetical protein